jgi:sarcosine oxidase subunit gamma
MSAFAVRTVQPASRLGLKGPDAAALLQEAGITVPSAPNRILLGPDSMRVLRLGNTEFVLETDAGAAALEYVRALARSADRRAWLATRADCCLLIGGDDIFDRLSRLCAFDFTQLAAKPDLAVMTLLAEISVTFVLEPATSPGDAAPQLRLWVDPGFATYLIQALHGLTPDVPSTGDPA